MENKCAPPRALVGYTAFLLFLRVHWLVIERNVRNKGNRYIFLRNFCPVFVDCSLQLFSLLLVVGFKVRKTKSRISLFSLDVITRRAAHVSSEQSMRTVCRLLLVPLLTMNAAQRLWRATILNMLLRLWWRPRSDLSGAQNYSSGQHFGA